MFTVELKEPPQPGYQTTLELRRPNPGDLIVCPFTDEWKTNQGTPPIRMLCLAPAANKTPSCPVCSLGPISWNYVSNELICDHCRHQWPGPQLHEATRHEVETREGAYDDSPILTANGFELQSLPALPEYRGAIYRHPSGHEKTFGFTHPIFVRPDSSSENWDWSHAKTKHHTEIIRPVAVLIERPQS